MSVMVLISGNVNVGTGLLSTFMGAQNFFSIQ